MAKINTTKEITDVLNNAWNETIDELTPEQREAMKNITPEEWAQATLEVAAEIVTGFTRMFKKY